MQSSRAAEYQREEKSGSRKKLGSEDYGRNQDDPHTAMLQDFSFVNVKISALLQTFLLHHHLLLHDQALWWVDYAWLPDNHPASLIPPPQQDRVENKIGNLMGQDTDREDHLPFTVMGKTDSTLGKLI